MRYKFALGNRVKCRVTGYQGLITARIEYINGCVQYAVRPLAKLEDPKGAYPDNAWLDEQTLQFVDEGITPDVLQELAESGGPSDPDMLHLGRARAGSGGPEGAGSAPGSYGG